MRARDIALKIGCSEAELVASGAGLEWVREVERPLLENLLFGLARQSGWMWLLRNECAVLERDVGTLSLGAQNDLLRFSEEGFHCEVEAGRVHHCYFVASASGPARSVQLFDEAGCAILKLFWRDAARVEAVDAMLIPLSHLVDRDSLSIGPSHGMVRSDCSEDERSNPEVLTDPVDVRAYATLIDWAREQRVPLTLEAANTGARMRVTVVPDRVVAMREWFNILDAGFNLHLLESAVEQAWLHRAPSYRRCCFFNGEQQPVLSVSLGVEEPLPAL